MADVDGFARTEPRAWLDIAAWMLFAISMAVPFSLDMQPGTQVAFTAVIGGIALMTWLWHRRVRVSAISSRGPRHLLVRAAGGEWLRVTRIDAGWIGRSLVSVRLITDGSQTLALFLPRGALSRRAHWQLCRMLLASRLSSLPETDQASR